MKGLAALLRAYGGAVEADLAAIGVDLRDMWRPGRRLTWRRLSILIAHLPADSATVTALRVGAPPELVAQQRRHANPEAGRWSRTDMLLAEVIDTIGRLVHVTLAANGVATRPPAPLPRPGVPHATTAQKDSARDARLSAERKAAIQRDLTGRPSLARTTDIGE